MDRRCSILLLVCAGMLPLLFMSLPAAAGFGLPESEGLLHVRSYETTGLGAIRVCLSQNYYYQDVGRESRYHRFNNRLGLAFGFGAMGQISIDTRLHGVWRRVSDQDMVSVAPFDDPAWQTGIGDSDLAGRLVLPVPGSRLRFAGEAVLRLPTGDESNNFGTGCKEYEVVGILSLELYRGRRFLPVFLHLNYGLRINRNPLGYAPPPGILPTTWSAPLPAYYPVLQVGETTSARRQIIYGAGLEFIGERMNLYAELSVDDLFHLRETMKLSEQPWQLALGFKADVPWQMELFGSFDINLARDDFDTDFEPHYPGLITTIGVSKRWQVLSGDLDNDGIRGDEDLCPDRPEDMDGFEDHDGCPDLDNDLDGILDIIDLAPNLPEDFDGFEDHDGRPDLDNDNDGIPDRDDLCPDRAEDYDGNDDEDGCPDRDIAPGDDPDSTSDSE
ncbi:MAG: hypothetical protein GY835_05955 [bacterium]|nr:hypothetical protein [bacterium]